MVRLITFLLLIMPLMANSQSLKKFNGLQFQESFKSGKSKLKKISDKVEMIKPKQTIFPLAKDKETHLIAHRIKLGEETIEKGVFVFADDSLCYVELQGNIRKALTFGLKKEPTKLLGYHAYLSELLFLKPEDDVAWLLTKEAMHPNLFAWNNPYLKSGKSTRLTYNTSVQIPSFMDMGGAIEKLKPLMESNSSFIHIQELDGSDPNAQTQINCFGVEYAGFPRKMEARFGDGKLNMVWVLTGKQEEERIRAELVASFGEPVFSNANWEAYNNWKIMLRKDKPELLFLTEKLIPELKKRIMQK